MPSRKHTVAVDLKTTLEAIPTAVFVVDADARVLESNTAAARLLGKHPSAVVKHLCGDVIACLHERDSKEPCGSTSFCRDCVIRNAVNRAAGGTSTYRAPCRMQVKPEESVRNAVLFITVTPFAAPEDAVALLVVEDITELSELRRLIPICAKCKKVRNDAHYWEQVDDYLNRHARISFTHTLCPDCATPLMEDAPPSPGPWSK